MILEGIVTTTDADGGLNVAPMGPNVEPGLHRFVLRPFRTSTTYRNLKTRGEGVFHVTDDVLLLARSAVGAVLDVPVRPAEHVVGQVLRDCCRYHEFRVTSVDDRDDRASFEVETVHSGRSRDFFGFNRAKHAVLEVAILATRVHFLPLDEVLSAMETHRTVVFKTGGADEIEAFHVLDRHVRAFAQTRGFAEGDGP